MLPTVSGCGLKWSGVVARLDALARQTWYGASDDEAADKIRVLPRAGVHALQLVVKRRSEHVDTFLIERETRPRVTWGE